MIYLASPYSHPDRAVRDARFRAACRAAVHLMLAGHTVFSPIAHGHGLCKHGLPTNWSFWRQFDRDHLARADELVVLTLDGWQESLGVQGELELAAAFGLPIHYADPVTLKYFDPHAKAAS